MEFTLSNPVKAEQFTTIFQHLKLFTDHVCLVFEKKGLYIQTMDNTRVSIFELTIPSTWFDQYSHKANSAVAIGISASLLFKILNTRDKAQLIKCEYNESDSDKLAIKFACDLGIVEGKKGKSEAKSVYDKHFEIPLIDITEDHMEVPDMEFQAEILLPSSIFASIIQQLKQFDCNCPNHILSKFLRGQR